MNTRELKKTVLGFREGLLGNRSPEFMCFAVCFPLQGYLFALGVETTMMNGEVDCADYNVNHFWLELPDGRIIDPTADQFAFDETERRLPKVYIGPKPHWYVCEENAA